MPNPLVVANRRQMRTGNSRRSVTQVGSALNTAILLGWIIAMRKMILAALAVLSLSACGWMAKGKPQVTSQSGPYDNTVNSLGGRFAGGVSGHR
jgi:hypothetical protein